MDRDDLEPEKEVRPKDMLFAGLYRWKLWLLAAVVCGLVLGGWRGVQSLKIAADPTLSQEQAKEYEDAMESYENTKEILEQTVESTRQDIEDQKTYLENSVLMGLDYRNVYESAITLYISTDYQIMPGSVYQNPDLTSVITAAYQAALENNGFLDDIARQVGMETRYLKELVTVSRPEETDRILTITVRHADAASAEKIRNRIDAQLTKLQQEVAETIGSHTLKTILGSTGSTVDTTLAALQTSESQLLDQYKDALTETEKELKDLKEPQITVASKRSALTSFLKWGVLGGVLGAALVFAAVCILFTARDRVYSAWALEDRCYGRTLAVRSAGQRKYDGLTRWLRKKEGRPAERTAASDALAAACVQQYCAPGGTLLVTGSAPEELVQEQAVFLKENLPEVNVVCEGSLLRDAAAVRQLSHCDAVLLVEACGRSAYTAVSRAQQMIQDAGKPLAGYLVLEDVK